MLLASPPNCFRRWAGRAGRSTSRPLGAILESRRRLTRQDLFKQAPKDREELWHIENWGLLHRGKVKTRSKMYYVVIAGQEEINKKQIMFCRQDWDTFGTIKINKSRKKIANVV